MGNGGNEVGGWDRDVILHTAGDRQVLLRANAQGAARNPPACAPSGRMMHAAQASRP